MEIRLPAPVRSILSKVPDKLPLENQVDRLLDEAADRLNNNLISSGIRRVEGSFPSVQSFEVSTPLGRVHTPHFQFPSALPPELDERKKEILKSAAGEDLANLIEVIPGLGSVAEWVAEPISITYRQKMLGLFNDQERDKFINYDKQYPLTTVAAINTFVRK